MVASPLHHIRKGSGGALIRAIDVRPSSSVQIMSMLRLMSAVTDLCVSAAALAEEQPSLKTGDAATPARHGFGASAAGLTPRQQLHVATTRCMLPRSWGDYSG